MVPIVGVLIKRSAIQVTRSERTFFFKFDVDAKAFLFNSSGPRNIFVFQMFEF